MSNSGQPTMNGLTREAGTVGFHLPSHVGNAQLSYLAEQSVEIRIVHVCHAEQSQQSACRGQLRPLHNCTGHSRQILECSFLDIATLVEIQTSTIIVM